MKINLFFPTAEISPFELGGFEFLGNKNNFLKECYKSQDLQMVFVSLLCFSYAIRTKKNKYVMSSNITFTYKEKSNTFFVNKIEIEKISYIELLNCLDEVFEESITLLAMNNDRSPVISDLRKEKNFLNKEKNFLINLLSKKS